MTTQQAIVDLLTWSPWQPLRDSWLAGRLPDMPGLYRIRRVGCDELDYIGQTGSGRTSLRQRAGMLRGVYGDMMPYRDPHTAGPALWALRHAEGVDFEISFVPVAGTTPWRSGLKCVAIGVYRQEHGQSPAVNWGRMPAGYRMSSGNNSRLVAAGKRIRGGPTNVEDASHLPGIAPSGSLGGYPESVVWCGHTWSSWMPLNSTLTAIPSGANGLYRVRQPNIPGLLVYIGQGQVRAGLSAREQKARDPWYAQAALFAGPIECSWVLNDSWYPHQHLELENDLIAGHILATGAIPPSQFLG